MRYTNPDKLQFKYNGFTFKPIVRFAWRRQKAIGDKIMSTMSNKYFDKLGVASKGTYEYLDFYSRSKANADIFWCEELQDYLIPADAGLMQVNKELVDQMN